MGGRERKVMCPLGDGEAAELVALRERRWVGWCAPPQEEGWREAGSVGSCFSFSEEAPPYPPASAPGEMFASGIQGGARATKGLP